MASQTSIMVAIGRAMAHGRILPEQFSDPTARPLLPDSAKARVDALCSGDVPRDFKGRMHYERMRRVAHMMVARTLTIDAVVRAQNLPQVVILGAGLDGRAWRMPELREATVFEVDHPDTQALKQRQVAGLTQTAHAVYFVGVDFTRDDLSAALERAGHAAHVPTMWVWEGVIMYLTRRQVEQTLKIVAQRSASKSCLSFVYHQRAMILLILGFFLRRVGEPLRSVFSARQMARLLKKCGFRVLQDEELPTIARRYTQEMVELTKSMRHTRIAAAKKV